MRSEMADMKIEIVANLTVLNMKDSKLDEKLTSAESKLSSLPGELKKIDSLYLSWQRHKGLQKLGWPKGAYCIFAGSDNQCPPGFTFLSSGIYAMEVWSCTGGSLDPKEFGASYIQKHGNCKNGNYADLQIDVCCK